MTRRSGLRLFTIWGLGGGGEDLAGTTFPRLLPLETVRSPGEALALLYPLAGWEREGFHHWLALVQEICKHLTKYSWTDMWTKGKCVKSLNSKFLQNIGMCMHKCSKDKQWVSVAVAASEDSLLQRDHTTLCVNHVNKDLAKRTAGNWQVLWAVSFLFLFSPLC